MNDTTPLTVIAIITAVSGHEMELRAAQEKLVEETLKESGCLRYELNQSIDDGRVLIFTETWASDALWRAHMEGDAAKNFKATGAEQFMADIVLHRMVQVAG